MDKNQIIKYVLIAGAVYLVYRYLRQSGALGQVGGPLSGDTGPIYDSKGNVIHPTGTTEPGIPVAPVTTVQPTVHQSSTATSDLRSKWAAMSAEDESGSVTGDGTRMHNFFHFHFMYQQLTGSTLPEPTTLGIDPYQDMTFDQFWNLLVSKRAIGLSSVASVMPTLSMLTRLASAWTM